MSLQRCKTLHAKRCKITNKLRDVRRTLSHMYGRLYGTTDGRNVVLNPVPSQPVPKGMAAEGEMTGNGTGTMIMTALD